MSTIKTEKYSYLEFNRPSKGYIFDLDKRCFAKMPSGSGIKSLSGFINYMTLLEMNGKNAQFWYESLDWKPEVDLVKQGEL